MFCSNCGKELSENMRFCDGCGAPCANEQVFSHNQPANENKQGKPMAKWRLYLGRALFVFGLLFIIWPIVSPETMEIAADGLDKTDVAAMIICALAFGGPGAWLIYKNKK